MPLPLVLTAAGASGVIATAVKWIVGYSIVRVIAALGVGLVTFTALDSITSLITNFIEYSTSGIGGKFWEVSTDLNVPNAIKVVIKVYVAAVAIRHSIFNNSYPFS